MLNIITYANLYSCPYHFHFLHQALSICEEDDNHSLCALTVTSPGNRVTRECMRTGHHLASCCCIIKVCPHCTIYTWLHAVPRLVPVGSRCRLFVGMLENDEYPRVRVNRSFPVLCRLRSEYTGNISAIDQAIILFERF